MEQKDFLLRKTEKIVKIISVIRQKVFGGKANLSITIEQQMVVLKGMLLNDANIYFDKLMNMIQKIQIYISVI